MGRGHSSINISTKTQEKEAPQGNILDLFLLDTLKTAFRTENLTQNQDTLFSIFKKSRGGLRFPP